MYFFAAFQLTFVADVWFVPDITICVKINKTVEGVLLAHLGRFIPFYGSMNIDHVYSTEHSVLPGETIIASSLALFCGGKGLNQSVAVAKAGGEIYHAGLIGEDGGMLVDQLVSAGVQTKHVARRTGASCHTIIRVDAKGQNSIIVYNTPGLQFDENDIDQILQDFDAGDLVMMQNELYNSALIMKKAAEKGLTVIFNPSPMDQNIMLTLGEKGSVCYCEGQLYHQSAYPVKAVDTTAAGDTFTGFFVTGLPQGKPIADIMKRASIASSIAVSRKGAADSIPTTVEVDEAEKNL